MSTRKRKHGKEEKSKAVSEKKKGKTEDAGKCPKTRRLLADPKRSVRDVILEQNRADKDLLHKLVAGEITRKQFKAQTSERLVGQWQWGFCSHNIRDSKYLCKHGCKYCYIGPMFARFGRNCIQTAMEDLMPVDKSKVSNVSPYGRLVAMPSDRKMVFFPSSSDIFQENAEDYVAACKKMIDAGHEIMYVTKTPKGAPEAVVAAFEKLEESEKYKRAMTIYITITSDDPAILDKFEPNAPKIEARLAALHYFALHGFHVNIMMEPYLSDPIPLLPKLLAELPPDGIITVGKMNYTPQITFYEDHKQNTELLAYLDGLYNRENTMHMYEMVQDNPRLFLKKDSVMAVVKFAGK